MATAADEAMEAGFQEPLIAGAETTPATTSSRRAAAAAATYAFVSHTGVWAFMGVLTVFALRVFGPPVLYFCAFVMAVLIAMGYYGYLNLNWRRVAHLGARALDADGDGRLSAGDLKVWLRRLADVCLGFGGTALFGYGLGLWIGVRMF